MSLSGKQKPSKDEISQRSTATPLTDTEVPGRADAVGLPTALSRGEAARSGGSASFPARDPARSGMRPWQRRVPVAWLIAIGVGTLLLATASATLLLSNRRLEVHVALVDRRPTTISTVSPATTSGVGGLFATVTPTAVRPLLTPSATVTKRPSTPRVSPTTSPESGTMRLSQAEAAYREAVRRRDRFALEQVLDLLAGADDSDAVSEDRLSALRGRVYYAMDALDGTSYLNESNAVRYDLLHPSGKPLVNPTDFTIGPSGLYLIDSGTVYAASLIALRNDDPLTLTAILTPTAMVGGYPIKEVVALDATNTPSKLFLLDKSGDLYHYDTISRTWQLETVSALQYTNPDPNFLNITTWDDRLYILDPARNQVWRYPPSRLGEGVLPGKLPWLLEPHEQDVSDGLDLAVDGAVFVLCRDGTIDRHYYEPPSGFQQSRFTLAEANARSHIAEMEAVSTRPVAIFADDEAVPLYVADPARRRVVAIHRQTGAFLRQFVAPANPDFALIRGVEEHDGWLYVLAGPRLYGVDVSQGITATLPLTGELPFWQAAPAGGPSAMHIADLAPNDPRLPALIAAQPYTMPVRGALLPDRPAIYPGARRAYRYGVHEGLDLYRADTGADIKVGTPVYAAGDGQIVRADTVYVEMTLDEINDLLDASNAGHYTPPETLGKLGGQQIWIDHGDGVSTRYLHLSAVAEGITLTKQVKMGDLIGYVGLSGTLDGIVEDTRFTHLHFEFRVGQADQAAYLGQWLTIEDARRAYELILKTPIRPAYLEEQPWRATN